MGVAEGESQSESYIVGVVERGLRREGSLEGFAERGLRRGVRGEGFTEGFTERDLRMVVERSSRGGVCREVVAEREWQLSSGSCLVAVVQWKLSSAH